MLQKLINTRPHGQPLCPIPTDGECCVLPSNFVDGLDFLRPFVKPRGKGFERQVGLLAGKLYLLTTSLVIEYDAGDMELPDFWFSPETIRILEAFKAPPTEVFVHQTDLCFRWQDKQELFVRLHHVMPSRWHRQMADEAFSHYRHFNQGVKVTTAMRRDLRKMHGGTKLAEDIYLNDQEIVSRMSSDGKTWTSETTTPFLSNANRAMRFDRSPFLNMVQVADEIDFSTSPVCFRHAHGRGVLVKRTLGSDIPTFGGADD